MDGKYAQFFVPVIMMVIMGCSVGAVYWHCMRWFRVPPLPVTHKRNVIGAVIWLQFAAVVVSMVIIAQFVGK